jgi:hypothetical protein
VEVEDRLLLPGFQPIVAGDQRVVLVDLAVALPPIVKLARAQREPTDEPFDGQLGAIRPMVDEVDDLVAGVVGNPASF